MSTPMRSCRGLCVSFFLILWLGSSALANEYLPPRFPPGFDWQQIESEHFIIVFDARHEAIARRLAQIAERVHHNITTFLNHTPAAKTYVVVTDHLDQFNAYAMPMPRNTVVVYLYEPGAGNSFFGVRSEDWLSLVFTHEYAHVVNIDRAGGWYKLLRTIFGRTIFPNASLPIWMIEGLAVYAETKFHQGRGTHPHYDMMMRTEVLEETIKPLDQMSVQGLRIWPVGNIVYLYGYFFTRYLAETYGEERLVQLNVESSRRFPLFGKNIFKKVFDGKNLTTLWREWRDALREQYQQQVEQLRSQPIIPTQPLSESGYFTNSPVFSPDGTAVYYLDYSPHEPAALVKRDLEDDTVTRLTTGDFSGDFSISPDGQRIYFCKFATYKTFSRLSDLYVLDLADQSVERLTNGLRAFDPAIAPDGKFLVFSTTEAGSMQLRRMDLETEEISLLWEGDVHTQIHHPAFSSDGTRLALQVWKQGGFEDVYLLLLDGSGPEPLTLDTASDSSPVWGFEDQYLFFSSDRTGVPNIFAYSLEEGRLYQVTNVLTGVFDPDVSPDGNRLILEHYSSQGMDIHLADLDPQQWHETPYTLANLPETPSQPVMTADPLQSREYAPLPTLLPTFWLPNWSIDEEGWQLGVMTGGRDVLGHHTYSLSVMQGLESHRPAYHVFYMNEQFTPRLTLGGYDTAQVFNDIFVDEEGYEQEYWQRNRGVAFRARFPLSGAITPHTFVTLGYQYHHMDNLSTITLSPAPDEGALSGVSLGLTFGSLTSSRYAISPEAGYVASLTYQRDDEALGSDYTLDTVVGDGRYYLTVPKLRHHILALKVAGGFSEGDTLAQGVFQLGGGFSFTSTLAELSQRRFFLRGYEENSITGHRFALGIVEYRFPIWFP
ncbi:BamA/TamA family outer membrane protein, partial [candidate division KSB3 bacterium]|nr:BamA/TamA family outer membrane protein [candidate division KSB3 bacterium]MBD3323925.1 BamA/TamA family outer membrane protein [candidate division KSB3 bacterium]